MAPAHEDLAHGSALGPIGSLTTADRDPAATPELDAGKVVLIIDEAVRSRGLSRDGARMILLTE